MRPESDAARDPSESCQLLFALSDRPTLAARGPGHVLSDANAAFGRLTGRSPGELTGRPFADAFPEGVANGRLALLDRVRATGLPETLAERENCGGPPSFWSYAAGAAAGPGGESDGVLLRVTDSTEAALFRRHAVAMNEALMITSVRQQELLDALREGEQARRDLQSRMLEAHKLESLGVLAGGVPHDLNDTLTPLLGFSELAIEILAKDAPAVPLIEEVAASARRVADLARRVLSYAGVGQHVVRTVDLSDLVGTMRESLKAAAPGAALSHDPAPGLPRVALVESEKPRVGRDRRRLDAAACDGTTGRVRLTETAETDTVA